MQLGATATLIALPPAKRGKVSRRFSGVTDGGYPLSFAVVADCPLARAFGITGSGDRLRGGPHPSRCYRSDPPSPASGGRAISVGS
jgi:hypothetical protein